MSAGARHGTTLESIEAEFVRITGMGLFAFPAWYAEQHRALRSSMDWRFPVTKADQESALLSVLKAKPSRPT